MNYTKHLIAGGLFALAMVGVSQAAVIKMIADGIATGAVGSETYVKRLMTDYHMVAANEYHLDGIIIVNPGVTLTVDPGTVIRGYNEIDTVANRPGTLIVDRGAKMIARGTATHPIIMTTKSDNNVPGQTAGVVNQTWKYRPAVSGNPTVSITQDYDYSKLGDLHGYWGGLVLCGKAFSSYNGDANLPALGDAKIPVEGIGAVVNCFGGGHDDNDSSGVYTYIQIRYGGYPLIDGSEINGMTFYGVGRGTEVHHIEVFNNQDDAFEWFGGTVNAKYLVAWGAGDDIFDSDCGFRGKNQFLFGVQRNMGGAKYESGCADKGMEMDGTEAVCVASPATSGLQEPFSASAWYNITLVGWNGNKKGNYYRNGAIVMRDNCAAQIRNSVFMNFGGFGTLIENKSGVGDYYSRWHFDTNNLSAFLPTATGTNIYGYAIDKQYLYQSQEPGMQAAIRDNVFWNCGPVTCPTGANLTTLGSPAGSDPLYGGDAAKGPVFTKGDNLDITAAGYNNVDVFENVDLPIKGFSVVPYNRTNSWGTGAIATSVSANTQTGDAITNINPLAANAAVSSAVPVVSDGVLTPVAYRGAFDTTNNWAQGWTTVAKLGVFGAYVPATDDASGTVYVTNTVTNGVSGIVYQGNGAPITSGTGVTNLSFTTSPVLTYTLTSAATYQLQSKTNLLDVSWTVLKTFTPATVPVTVNLTDIVGETPPHAGDSRFYRLVKP
ncbi:MAG: hypothetical protein WCG22_01125 [Lentisphaerota bacterium]